MERNHFNSKEKYSSEGELLKLIRNKGKYSLESSLSNARDLLYRQIGRNGDNMYNLLVRLISNLLDNPSVIFVDHFEELCRLAKIDYISTEACRKLSKATNKAPKQAETSAQKQTLLSKHMLDALTQIEAENIRYNPGFCQFVRYGLNTMGRDLPYGYDYFISTQIERTLRSYSDVKSCQFWGVMRSLGCDYYILEIEHCEKTVHNTDHLVVTGNRPKIVTKIDDASAEGNAEEKQSSGDTNRTDKAQIESLETVRMITHPLLMEILGTPALCDRDTEKDDGHSHIDTLLTEMIDLLTIESPHSSDFVDPCARRRSRSSEESTASLIHIQRERMLFEERLNCRSYLVTENPCIKPWHLLPPVTLEQLEATKSLRVFLVGNLQAPVRGLVRPFDGLEENLLRAYIAKISAHRHCCIYGSATNISIIKCLSGTYDCVTGYDHELPHACVERWCERKEHGMQYWTSETWPGLCTFKDGEQLRYCYFGWGLEKQSRWYSPIVRIAAMREEYYEPVQESKDD